MNKKVLVLVTSVVVLIGISVLSIYSVSATPINSDISYGVKYTGIACEQVIRVDGTVEDLGCQHNLVTNRGLEIVKTALNGTAGFWNLTNLTVGGNTTPQSAADTSLANAFATNGLAPVLATYTVMGTGNSSLNYQWTVATAQSTVNTTGIYNQTSANTNFFAEAYWTPATVLQIGDKLNVTYYWWVA